MLKIFLEPETCHTLSILFPSNLPQVQFSSSSVQLLSHAQLSATPWTAAYQASLSITTPKFTQTHVHWVSDAVQPSHPLLSPSPPAFNLSQHQGLFFFFFFLLKKSFCFWTGNYSSEWFNLDKIGSLGWKDLDIHLSNLEKGKRPTS